MLRVLRFSLIVLFCLSCTKSDKTSLTQQPTPEPEAATESKATNYHLLDIVEKLTPKDYEGMLDSLKAGLPVDFFRLRMAYTTTKDYSPYDIVVREIQRRISKYLNASEFKKALAAADTILSTNYVDVRTHLYCSYAYKQLGDSANADFHYYVYQGLLNSIVESGDGKSVQTAYIVITTKEEYALIDALNMKHTMQSLVHDGEYRFDLMHTVDRKTDEEHKLYFNVDLPFSYFGKIFKKKDE